MTALETMLRGLRTPATVFFDADGKSNRLEAKRITVAGDREWMLGLVCDKEDGFTVFVPWERVITIVCGTKTTEPTE